MRPFLIALKDKGGKNMSSDFLQNMLGDDFKDTDIVSAGNVKYLNGIFQYIKFDVDKPGKSFFDITKVWNASTGEVQKELPIQFTHGNRAIDLNSVVISADGLYPDNTTDWHVTGANITNGGVFTKFVFPLGVFSQCGTYPFRFTITNTSTGQKETSHWMYFDVTPNATALATSWNEDIKPFDSDYTKWKADVSQWHAQEQDYMAKLLKETKATQDKIDQQAGGLDTLVDAEVNNKMGQPNTWGGLQTFNNGIGVTGGTTTDSLDAQSIKYHAGLLADKGNDLESGLIVHDTTMTACSDGGPSKGASFLNGAGTNSTNHGYISFNVLKMKDYTGVSIHANCKIPKGAIGKPIVQFAESTDFDQTPFRLGDYILGFDTKDNTLNCIAGTTSNPNETVMDTKTLL